MTGRERMIETLKNGQADRVPVAPDISNMIPCRLTGKPYWEIYLNSNPNLGQAYIDAVDYYGIDAWYTYGGLRYKTNSKVEINSDIIEKTREHWKRRTVFKTSAGELSETLVYPVADSPTKTEKIIKDFKEDFEKYLYLYPEIIDYDDTYFKEQKKRLGERGIMCVPINPPGLHIYVEHFNGNLEAATYAYYDYPELFEELRVRHEKYELQKLEMVLEAGVDSILTGGSGSITLQSPDIWRKLSLPTLKKITKMCKEAGVISGIHSCGKEHYLVETCANETELDYVNPLEIPPMGDCNLADVKSKFGDKLALMGNLHTVDVMLYGRPEEVRLESLKAIRDAGENGGFVLSTGDQCGRDTPDENIFAMVEVVKEYGQYPLDLMKIESEIDRLKNEIK